MRFGDEFRIRLNGYQCCYCGDPAGTDEHYPPASLSRRGLIMPCCLECNMFAGTAYSFSFSNRCYHVKQKIRSKYRKFLSSPKWEDWELNEMSEVFREEIKKCEKVKELINERLVWSATAYLSSIAKENTFAAMIAECDTITNLESSNSKDIENYTIKKETKEDCYSFIANFT